MPERTFRIFIKNSSSDTTLHLKEDPHCCHGQFTSADWTPPQQIMPGEEKGFQAESSGILTGTEGFVKYEAVENNMGFGMIYVWWDNPWYGRTDWRLDKDVDDITSDCDFDGGSSGGSNFSPPKPTNFDLRPTGFGWTESGSSDRSLSAGDLANMVALPWSWLGLAGILRDPVLHTNFVVLAPPQFGSLGSESVKPLSNATVSNWAGEWGGESVSIKIRNAGWDLLRATISDQSTSPALESDQTFAIGNRSQLVTVGLEAISAGTGHSERALTHAMKTAASQALQSATPDQPRWAIASQVSSAFVRATAKHSTPLTAQAAARASQVVADAYSKSRWQAWLANNIGLELFALFQGRYQVGERLHYQRLTPGGVVITDRMLNPVPDVH